MTKTDLKETLKKGKEEWKNQHNLTSDDLKSFLKKEWKDRYNSSSNSSERAKLRETSRQQKVLGESQGVVNLEVTST